MLIVWETGLTNMLLDSVLELSGVMFNSYTVLASLIPLQPAVECYIYFTFLDYNQSIPDAIKQNLTH